MLQQKMTNTQATDHTHVELTPGVNTAAGVAVSGEEDGISSCFCSLFSLPLLLVPDLAYGVSCHAVAQSQVVRLLSVPEHRHRRIGQASSGIGSSDVLWVFG